MFSALPASKRVRYRLVTKVSLRYSFGFLTLLDMYESEYFPVRNLLRRRFLGNWARRWSEPGLYVRLLLSVVVLRWKLDAAALR